MEPSPVETPQPRKRGVVRGVSELMRTILLAMIVFIGARTVVLPYEVEGASMFPNLHDQERVLVNRTVYFHFSPAALVNWLPGVEVSFGKEIYPFHPPERGDIIVLDPPVRSNQPYIKRIIALPGESVSFRDGYVYVNGERLDEPYIDGAITECRHSKYCNIEEIGPGEVYVLGDNRDNSSDSRSFGPVRIEDIVGKAWFTNWPLTDIGLIPHYEYQP